MSTSNNSYDARVSINAAAFAKPTNRIETLMRGLQRLRRPLILIVEEACPVQRCWSTLAVNSKLLALKSLTDVFFESPVRLWFIEDNPSPFAMTCLVFLPTNFKPPAGSFALTFVTLGMRCQLAYFDISLASGSSFCSLQ